jgi:hypothetical protein
MNSIHRVGLLIAGLATVLTVGAAFVISGYTSAQRAAASAAAPVVADALTSTATPVPTASPSLDPQIVYIAPVPSPGVVHVTAPANTTTGGAAAGTPAGPAPTPPVIHVVVPGPVGDDGSGGDD